MTYNKTPKVGNAYRFYFNGTEKDVMVSHVEEDVIRGRIINLLDSGSVDRKHPIVIIRSHIAAFSLSF